MTAPSERRAPLAIKVMLHHACHPTHWEPDSAAYREVLNRFIDQGVLFRDVDGIYRPTDLGYAFVEAICRTPIPEQRFVDPRTQETLETTP